MKKKVGHHKEKMTNTQALDIVVQQLLMGEYEACDPDVDNWRSDLKAGLGLRTTCKQLAGHYVRDWAREMETCIWKSRELWKIACRWYDRYESDSDDGFNEDYYALLNGY